MKTSARHETRALLRAHLSAATRYRHATRHCAVCHRLLRLALEPQALPERADGRTGRADVPRGHAEDSVEAADEAAAGRPQEPAGAQRGPAGAQQGARSENRPPSPIPAQCHRNASEPEGPIPN